MTDPWAQVATALGHDHDESSDDRAGATTGWATIADRLSSTTDTPADTDRQSAISTTARPAVAPVPIADDDGAGDDEPGTVGEEVGSGERRRRRPGLVGKGRGILAALVAVLVAVGLVLYLAWPSGGLPAGTAMSVAGRDVSVNQLNGNIQVLTHFYGITAPPQSDAGAYATYLQTEAKAYAIDLIVQQQAPRHGVSVSDTQVNNEYNALVKSVAGGDGSKLDQLFSQYGLTQAQVRDQIRFQLLEVALYNKVVGSPTVANAQVQRTYAANASALTVPETRTVSHIVVADPAAAQSVLTQLQQGANFAQLAANDSLDTSSKANSGSLGTHAEEELSPAFGKAAFAAALNVPFGPVDEGNTGSTKNGYDVGLVTAITPGHPPTNDAATQALIRRYLVGVDKNAAWQRWLTGALQQAHVTYAAAYRPADPRSAPPTQAPSLRQLVLQAADGATTASSPSSAAP